MGQWYVRVRGQRPLGPVTTEQLAAGIGAGQVPVDAVVCRVGGSEWSPLAACPELGEVLRQVAPPPPDSLAPGPPPAAPAAPPPRPQVVPHVPAAAAPVPAVVHAPAQAAPVFRPPPPTPPLGAWVAIIAGPLALLVLHLAVIGSEGTLPLVLLVVAAVIVRGAVVKHIATTRSDACAYLDGRCQALPIGKPRKRVLATPNATRGIRKLRRDDTEHHLTPQAALLLPLVPAEALANGPSPTPPYRDSRWSRTGCLFLSSCH